MAAKTFLQVGSELFLKKSPQTNAVLLISKVKNVRSLHSVCAKNNRCILSWRHTPAILRQQFTYTSSTLSDQEIRVQYSHGLPQLYVPLPSRNETCQFTLWPANNNVADLIDDIQDEDPGVDRVAVYTPDGTRIAGSTSINLLLQNQFQIVINDLRYNVNPPTLEDRSVDHVTELSDVKNTIAQLHGVFNVPQHQLQLLHMLEERRGMIQHKLKPYQEQLAVAEKNVKRAVVFCGWGLLGYMSLQTGLFARLTFWEYSWDIMEPITYFASYFTSILCMAYYVLTKQDFTYDDCFKRQRLLLLYRFLPKDFNFDEYNKLMQDLSTVETDLRRLRDPLQLQLPLSQLPPYKFRHEFNQPEK